MSTETSISLIHADAPSADMPPAGPKPTSLDGQTESTLELWSDGGNAGVWECSPGRFTAVRDGYSEVCQILAGRGSIEGEDGVRADLEPGSLIVLPSGWRGTWTITETMRKTYVIIPDSPQAS